MASNRQAKKTPYPKNKIILRFLIIPRKLLLGMIVGVLDRNRASSEPLYH